MLNKLFNRRRYRELQLKPSDFTYHGDVGGTGVNERRDELAKRTARHSAIQNAWFAQMQYGGENNIRVLLLIDSNESSENERQRIVTDWADVIPMDIVFGDSLPTDLVDQVKRQLKPLYLENNNLYHCPIVVERGHNESATAEWVRTNINV